ncbi:MAG: CHC2 zinc finger domain-containing protein [Acidimicrobiales bacterium]
MGLCPFHPEKTPSFSVNEEAGLFYCFGCQKKGDAITFLRELEGLDFVGAVERLAAKANVSLRYTDADAGESRKRRNRLVDAVERAVQWYHERLLSGPDAGPARATCAPGASPARRCGRSAWVGRPPVGTSWPSTCASATPSCVTAASAWSTAGAASRTSSARASCSPSSMRRAQPSGSGAASWRAPTGPSTSTRAGPPSTISPRSSTGCPPRRPTSFPCKRPSSARGTPT